MPEIIVFDAFKIILTCKWAGKITMVCVKGDQLGKK